MTTAVSPRRGIFAASLCALAVATAAMTGCATEAVAVRPHFGEVVTVAPPLPQAEVMGVAPFAGAVWAPGYWNWVGGKHVWVAGRWEHPREGLYWEPHTWVHVGGGWHLREGYWARR